LPGLHHTPTGMRAEVFAPAAELVELCLFEPDGTEVRHALSARDGWHEGEVEGLSTGHHYGFRTYGPWDPGRGLWHHPGLLLQDPFARAVTGDYVDHPALHHDGPREDTAPWVPRSVVVEAPPPPRPGPKVPWQDTVIYETHVRGLSIAHPEVDPALRGTYLGACSEPVVEHLLGLGVTTVELMPVAQHVTEAFLQRRGLRNYWGYSTLLWFAPHGAYATADDGRQVAEFSEMVDRFHSAGLEVVLDVVFNHTVEGDLSGPILCHKGLDNTGWYRWADGKYVDWTGTGNTVDTSNPRVREAIVAALRWWAEDLGVDGFRFDLAATLARSADGHFDPSQLHWLTDDPVLADRKLIAEPWDLGPHGYRLGGFGGEWREWNARFRDDVRDFWRGHGSGGALIARVGGSADVFGDRSPFASVNFVTAHDGFTMEDLVSYDHKHNEANGEENRDGHDDNRSWNSGVEGPTDDPSVTAIRRRRAAALTATVMLAHGVPMLLGGDELGRTKGGNNNSYPLDQPNWYRWSEQPRSALIAQLTSLRRQWPELKSGETHLVHDHPVAVIEMGRLLLLCNPTGDEHRVRVPGGERGILLDTSNLDASGKVGGELTVPSWSALLLGPAS
jgi:isoamylase